MKNLLFGIDGFRAAPYSQPAIEQLRAKFREAVQLLQFISEAPMIPKDVQEKIAALEAEQNN
jgi:hypothetical protein